MMGNVNNISLVPGKLGDSMEKLEWQGTCEGPMRCISHTGAHLLSCKDVPRTPEIIEATRETLDKSSE